MSNTHNRSYKICIACHNANPNKIIRLNLTDKYCRKCGLFIDPYSNHKIVKEEVGHKTLPDYTVYTSSTIPGSGYTFELISDTNGVLNWWSP